MAQEIPTTPVQALHAAPALRAASHAHRPLLAASPGFHFSQNTPSAPSRGEMGEGGGAGGGLGGGGGGDRDLQPSADTPSAPHRMSHVHAVTAEGGGDGEVGGEEEEDAIVGEGQAGDHEARRLQFKREAGEEESDRGGSEVGARGRVRLGSAGAPSLQTASRLSFHGRPTVPASRASFIPPTSS